MNTLKEIIEARKCRTGKSDGTTKDGAYWLACDPILIRSWGGDGIGQSGTNLRNYLQLRHYRNGGVRAIVRLSGWHQNYGTNDEYLNAPILNCTTVEDVIVILKGITEDDSSVYADYFGNKLTSALTGLGMVESAPSPDECDAKAA